MRLRAAAVTSVVVLALFAASCSMKFGREFPSPKIDSIVNGRTAKADLVRMFGEPRQVGMKDGDQTWTWYYAQQGGKEEFAKQLEVTFNNQGLVKSHNFSSSFPEDMKVR
jgi:outer membrane protein assembly factor BamE (lipoprotein component of BamABCDE complex)